jgi:nucleoside-diphosphate-sugar epimerase
MRIFLTGATGYVGSKILAVLLEQGHEVVCLSRTNRTSGSGQRIIGDLLQPETYAESLKQCDAVIHLVGIIREQPSRNITYDQIHVQGTQMLVNACIAAGFVEGGKRFIHMSALGASAESASTYFTTKWQAEEIIRTSGLTHIIFRPSIIFGPNDEFVNMLAGLVKMPMTPVIGDGRYRMQPVSLRTVAEIFVKALSIGPVNVAFNVGGPEQITYNDMLIEIGRALRRNVHLVHLPLWFMRPIITVMERFPFFPITTNQLTMLLEENICRDGTPFAEIYEVQPVRFREGIREYL